MKQLNESLKHTVDLNSQCTPNRLAQNLPQTATLNNVTYVEFHSPPKSPLPNAVDIDDLLTELESQSTENADGIAQGRQWVAATFYADRLSMAQLRLRKGWSQTELAKHIETSQSHIARIESGITDPQLSTIRKISKALDVPLETLVKALVTEGET